MKLIYIFSALIVGSITFLEAGASSLSYSGRLVGNNGAPVVGPVKLRFDLAYNTDTTDILCTDEINGLDLINGVFHAKIDFDCGPSSSLEKVLLSTPVGSTVSIRVTDITNISSHRVYSFQALHSIPFAIVSGMASQLAPLNATDPGQVLTWDGSKWGAASPSSTTNGTVTSITANEGLSGGVITASGFIGIADGGVTSQKLAPMGASVAGQVLKWNGSTWMAGIDSGLASESDPTVKNFAKIDLPACGAGEYYTHDVIVGFRCEKISSDDLSEGTSNLFFSDTRAKAAAVADALNNDVIDVAPSQNVVFDQLLLKQDKIDGTKDIKMKSLTLTNGDGTWATIQAPAGAGNKTFIWPGSHGEDGQVLTTTSTGVLGWSDLEVNGSSISSGSIKNSHIAADAEIEQSKISGLSFDLGNIDSRITNLNTSNIPEHPDYLYFTEPRVLETKLAGINTAAPGVVDGDDSIFTALEKIIGNQSKYLEKSGGSMSGNLGMGGNLITGLGAPSDDGDAATKGYVDSQSFWEKVADPGNDIYYTSGNVGIGLSTLEPNIKLQLESDTTDTSSRGINVALRNHSTVDGNLSNLAAVFKALSTIAPGVTNSGGLTGFWSVAFRNNLLGTVDSGTLDNMRGGYIQYGHYNSEAAAAPLTTSAYGLYISPYYRTGTIANMYDIYTHPGAAGGVVTNHYGLHIGGAQKKNFIEGTLGIGTLSPNAKLTVDGVLSLKEGAPPAATSDYGKLYVGTDSKLYFLNDLGVTTVLGSSDGGTPGDNTITSDKISDGSIVDADINASAGISAAKLGTGVVDNDELSYLNGVTGPIQTQLNNIKQVPAATGADSTKYLRGDNTWQTITTTEVSEGTNKYFTSELMQDTPITNYIIQPANALNALDKLPQALGKLQGQINLSNSEIGTLKNKGQWEKNSTSLYYDAGNVGIKTTSPDRDMVVADSTGLGNRGIAVRTFASNTGGVLELASALGSPSAPEALITGKALGYLIFNGYDGTSMNMQSQPTGLISVATENWSSTAHGAKIVFNTTPNGTTIGVNRMTLDEDGDLGIGVLNPSQKLDVSGNVKATAYLYTSDRRLKENIETIQNSSEKALALRGVEFDWKQNGNHEIGFIAQEVEAIEPSLVVTSEVDGIKAVKYGNVVAILVEAFKEHHKKLEENHKLFMTMNQGTNTRVKELEREVASLKDENKKLKEDIELIKKHLKIK